MRDETVTLRVVEFILRGSHLILLLFALERAARNQIHCLFVLFLDRLKTWVLLIAIGYNGKYDGKPPNCRT